MDERFGEFIAQTFELFSSSGDVVVWTIGIETSLTFGGARMISDIDCTEFDLCPLLICVVRRCAV